MIPIGDDDSGHTLRPWVNYILLALNGIVFIVFQGMGQNENFTLGYAMVPWEILHGEDVIYDGMGISPTPVYLTLLSSFFLHGSWMHLLGNMLYLWIYGDNLENRMGHLSFLIFYLVCGLMASAAHILYTQIAERQDLIPSLGASGAIAGIMGGYVLLFPNNRIRILFFGGIIYVRAFLALGIWILMQLISGYSNLMSDAGGVAYAAHIGGFIVGMLMVKLFPARKNNGLVA